MAEDSNSKELLENSRELVGTSKELLESTTGIAENIMLLVSGSKELSDINKEQLSKLLAIETAVNGIESVNPDEIKAYMDKVVTLINPRQEVIHAQQVRYLQGHRHPGRLLWMLHRRNHKEHLFLHLTGLRQARRQNKIYYKIKGNAQVHCLLLIKTTISIFTF